ncbi:MAG: peptidoglycan DD-metalloendopeptidase family protein [Sphingomonas sp.]|uniref:murein hydrolase activator EnvC family protein n=1 Tax=Sphingomonas sp. TaxID=28214 RepID=UPI001B1C30D6|nr:peptidoglycan DD-metalloendopeptidase family protein [Sphingomonas sp.]MBO9622113.1 peptidoglycan DD-metalloendopeptidase family protein [Sphingomonas sp.]
MGPARSITLTAALLAMLGAGAFAGAQVPTLGEQQQRLKAANRAAQAADARAQALEREAEGQRDQAVKARASEAAAAERIRAAEAEIAAAGARIAIVDRLLTAQRARMAQGQGPVVRLVAALQSMARRPAMLGLVQPGSTEDMVHVRAVLATTMPLVQARTAGIRAELDRTRRLRASAEAAVAKVREGRARLEQERTALVRLEAEHRARSQALGRSALAESDRALALGEQARAIVDQMETIGAAAQIQSELAALPGPLPRPPAAGETAKPLPRHAPAYRLPVAGRVVTGLGEVSATGVRARGLTLECAPNAPVAAPAAGRVLYAGPFRAYGGVVILDHGHGWTTLVAGLGRIAVRVGDQLRQGSPIGRASAGDAPRVTVELRRRDVPMDLAQLLD